MPTKDASASVKATGAAKATRALAHKLENSAPLKTEDGYESSPFDYLRMKLAQGHDRAQDLTPDLDEDQMVTRLKQGRKLFELMEAASEIGDNLEMEDLGDDEVNEFNYMITKRAYAADANVLALGAANEIELSKSVDDFMAGHNETDGCMAWFGHCGNHPEYTGQRIRVEDAADAKACLARAESYALYCSGGEEGGGSVNLSFYSGNRLVESLTTPPAYMVVSE